MAESEITIQEALELGKKTVPSGVILFKVAQEIIASRTEKGFLPMMESLDSHGQASRKIWESFVRFAVRANGVNGIDESDLETFGCEVFLLNFAISFLEAFPTVQQCAKKFNRPIPFSQFLSSKKQETIEQILNLTLDEANMLIDGKPLLQNIKNDYFAKKERAESINKAPQKMIEFSAGSNSRSNGKDLQIATELPEWKVILEKLNFQDKTGWDVMLITLWNDGHDRKYISGRANVTPARVTNRISELRRMLGLEYGEKVLPKEKERKARMIKTRYMA